MSLEFENINQVVEITNKGKYFLVPENEYKQLITLLEKHNLLKLNSRVINLGEIIINYRKLKGLNQKSLAKEAGITVASLCNLEKGNIKKPQQKTLRLLTSALGEEFKSTLIELDFLKETA